MFPLKGLTGESRFTYCYVRPHKVKQFETYMKKYLSEYCYLFKSIDLVKKGYFGLFNSHPKLEDRIGDYTLIMKDNYIIRDTILGEKPNKFKIGQHGGMSKEEMFVPLVIF